MGRGLAAILPRTRTDELGLRELPLDLIVPSPNQPRTEFDEQRLLELAESIRAQGLLQPIVARSLAGGRYELIAGERRFRAARIAQLERIPAVVRAAEDSECLELALAENVARVDLNPIEEARACALLVDDLGLSKGEVGKRVGKSRVAVSNLIRLLVLPDETLALIASGGLSEGHGRAILTCPDHEERRRLGRSARDEGWSVRETERQARPRAEDGPRRRRARAGALPPPDLVEAVRAAQEALSAVLGQDVKVEVDSRGVLAQLRFGTPAEVEELAERLQRGTASTLTRVA